MTQLLQYNCYTKYKEGAKTFRHSQDRETPFPVFIGMSTYAKTRKRLLVELLHDHGVSIPYDRVLEISAQLGDTAVNQYNAEGVVCPTILRKDIFTTAAMDNIDHNPTATSASTSFHGTSISIFQHPTSENKGQIRDKFSVNIKAKKVPELPDSFTNIRSAFFTDKQPKPSSVNVPISFPTLQLNLEFDWLQKVNLIVGTDDTEESSLLWPSHYASMHKGQIRDKFPVNIKAKKVPELPDSFTNIRPAFFTDKQPKPSSVNVPISFPTLQLNLEFDWLQKVNLIVGTDDTEEISLSWSTHHASMHRGQAFEVSITSLLPLLRDQAHSVATIRQVMDKVKGIVDHLNPGQIPIIAANQPIYAIAKHIQWHWPDRYGENKFIIMFGGLHIEMAAFKSIGTLLRDSGWTGALKESWIAASGTAESFLFASSVTRKRQMHKVTACCL